MQAGGSEQQHRMAHMVWVVWMGYKMGGYDIGGNDASRLHTHTHGQPHAHTHTKTHRQTHIEGPQKTFVTISHVNTSCQERLSHTHTYAKHNYNCHNTKAAENLVPSAKSSTN